MSPSRSRKCPSAAGPDTIARARKRRRAAAAVPPSSASPWTSLPVDMVQQISWRVLAGDFLDYVRFRAVCTSWRSAAVCPRGRGVTDPRFHPRRWMMLPEGHGLYPGSGKLRGYVRFFNLDTGTFVRVKLPLFRDHCALDSPDGLLLLQRDEDTVVRLLHPFTGDTTDLPPFSTLLPQLENDASIPRVGTDPDWLWSIIRYCVCASVSCHDDGVITVMLALNRLNRVLFATSQDQQWTMPRWDVPVNLAPLSLRGKLYFVKFPPSRSTGTLVFQMDPPVQAGSALPRPKLIARCPPEKLCYGFHLVECDSQIMLVGHTDSSYSKLLIYKLEDLMLERYLPVTSIGDRALFLEDRSLSVSSKALPTVMAETVIYTHPIKRDFAQYDLTTGAWSLPIDEDGLDGSNPGPCSLIQHVISCCIRNVWNKGLVYSIKETKKPGWLLWKVKRKLRVWS